MRSEAKQYYQQLKSMGELSIKYYLKSALCGNIFFKRILEIRRIAK